MKLFDPHTIKKLYVPPGNSYGEDNGQVTIIGGSKLFHGAPVLSLTAASRIVDMVFFSSPLETMENLATEIKSKLSSFIWVPWNHVESYIEKSDAILPGPGLMRYKDVSPEEYEHRVGYGTYDRAGRKTRSVTKYLLQEFPKKKWVIDAGSLQTMDPEWIPENAIVTPNKKEFQLLFKNLFLNAKEEDMKEAVTLHAKKHKCIIVFKGPVTFVSNGKETIRVEGGNAGLTKGGTGDVLAGLTLGLLAKNDPMLAATVASYVVKKTAEELEKERGLYFNADDVASRVPEVLSEMKNKK